MKQNFHIIDRISSLSDWDAHDTQRLTAKRAELSQTAQTAQARDLEDSAKRFRPSDDLLLAMNAALAARVPLLLTGDPGTGKTQVAWYIKCFFQIPLYSYQVHSNSQASEMRYDFDAVAYLRDAYLQRDNADTTNISTADADMHETDLRADQRYLKRGALWQAYECADECVLLIDEIDKAPRDFPNDLLQELDQNRFEHPFYKQKTVRRSGPPPITIITSNGERRLPDAFLRRCMVHHIEITEKLLREIMQAWDSQFPELNNETREMALKRFWEIRAIPRLSKRPGTAELLLWLSVLSAQGRKLKELDESVARRDLPALMCLIKDQADYVHLD